MQAKFQQQNPNGSHRNEVVDWLNGLSLQQYIDNFMENGFESFESLRDLRLSRQDLVKIGVRDVTHRDKILNSLGDFESHC